jgi:hypothetical protein
MMKVIRILLLLISFNHTSPAQELFVGAGFATGYHSDMKFINDSFTLETSNSQGRKFIVPSISVETNLSQRLRVGLRLNYRRHTISLRGWQNSADTCSLCPLKKGGGPTVREIRASADASWRLKDWSNGMLLISTGVGLTIPINVDTNDSGLAGPLNDLFESAGSLAESSFIFEVGMLLFIDRFQFRIAHGYTPSYTRVLQIGTDIFPFKTNESIWSFSAMYRVYRRSRR